MAQLALAEWRNTLLRVTLALVWLLTAFVTLCVYPAEESRALLARVGLVGASATVALYGAIALDVLMGVASLVRPSRKLWLAQGALVLGYSAIIAFALPEFLAQPFGPILKNLPILALLFLLYAEEK